MRVDTKYRQNEQKYMHYPIIRARHLLLSIYRMGVISRDEYEDTYREIREKIQWEEER